MTECYVNKDSSLLNHVLMLHCTLVATDDGKYYNGRGEGFV